MQNATRFATQQGLIRRLTLASESTVDPGCAAISELQYLRIPSLGFDQYQHQKIHTCSLLRFGGSGPGDNGEFEIDELLRRSEFSKHPARPMNSIAQDMISHTEPLAAALEQRAATQAMVDPMSRMMASRGMPLGFAVDGMRQVDAAEAAAAEVAALSSPPRTEPAYKMEALDDIFTSTKPARSTPPVATPGNATMSGSVASDSGVASFSTAAGGGGGGGGESVAVDSGGGLNVDAWGTTRQSSAEIARRLVESNAELERQASLLSEGDDEVALDAALNGGANRAGAHAYDDPSNEPVDDTLLAPGEAKYKTLEQMSNEIKGLDEVFEVLAQVPWLDDDNIQQKELKGVAMVGLLGTLEEVGFNIRDQLHRIWSGDHDDSMILECSSARDQAALISILFHTKKIRDQFGEPSSYLEAPVGANGGAAPHAISFSIAQRLATAKKASDGEK